MVLYVYGINNKRVIERINGMSDDKKTSLEPEVISEIIKSGESEGMTVKEFSDRYQVKPAFIYNYRYKHGNVFKLSFNSKGFRKRIADMLQDNPYEYTISEIASIFALTQRSVYVVCKEANLPYKETKQDERLKKNAFMRHEPAFIQAGYTIKDLPTLFSSLTRKEIAKKFNVTVQCVYQWSKNYLLNEQYQSTRGEINIPENFEEVAEVAVFKKELTDYYQINTYELTKWFLTTSTTFYKSPYPWLYRYGVTEDILEELGYTYSYKDLATLFNIGEGSLRQAYKDLGLNALVNSDSRGVSVSLKPLTIDERLQMSKDACYNRIKNLIKRR